MKRFTIYYDVPDDITAEYLQKIVDGSNQAVQQVRKQFLVEKNNQRIQELNNKRSDLRAKLVEFFAEKSKIIKEYQEKISEMQKENVAYRDNIFAEIRKINEEIEALKS